MISLEADPPVRAAPGRTVVQRPGKSSRSVLLQAVIGYLAEPTATHIDEYVGLHGGHLEEERR